MNYLHARSVSTELVKWNRSVLIYLHAFIARYWVTYMPPLFSIELLTCPHCSVLNYLHAQQSVLNYLHACIDQHWVTYKPPRVIIELLTLHHKFHPLQETLRPDSPAKTASQHFCEEFGWWNRTEHWEHWPELTTNSKNSN